jgi:hypothetical protein
VPVLTDPNYIVSAGPTSTSVPHETASLGFVTKRKFEEVVIVIGVIGRLAIVTLRQLGAPGCRGKVTRDGRRDSRRGS